MSMMVDQINRLNATYVTIEDPQAMWKPTKNRFTKIRKTGFVKHAHFQHITNIILLPIWEFTLAKNRTNVKHVINTFHSLGVQRHTVKVNKRMRNINYCSQRSATNTINIEIKVTLPVISRSKKYCNKILWSNKKNNIQCLPPDSYDTISKNRKYLEEIPSLVVFLTIFENFPKKIAKRNYLLVATIPLFFEIFSTYTFFSEHTKNRG